MAYVRSVHVGTRYGRFPGAVGITDSPPCAEPSRSADRRIRRPLPRPEGFFRPRTKASPQLRLQGRRTIRTRPAPPRTHVRGRSSGNPNDPISPRRATPIISHFRPSFTRSAPPARPPLDGGVCRRSKVTMYEPVHPPYSRRETGGETPAPMAGDRLPGVAVMEPQRGRRGAVVDRLVAHPLGVSVIEDHIGAFIVARGDTMGPVAHLVLAEVGGRCCHALRVAY